MHNSWMRMILLTRAAVGVFLLTAVVLVLAPQTDDMLVGIFDGFNSEGIWTGVAFHLALFVLAFNLWHWSRAVLSGWFEITDSAASRADRAHQPNSRGQIANPTALRLLPRALFVGGALIGIAAAARSSQWLQVIVIAVWSTGFYGFLTRRLALQPRLFGAASLARGKIQPAPSGLPRFLRPFWTAGSDLLSHAPFGRRVAGAALIVAIIMMFTGTIGTFFPFAWWAAWPTLVGTYFPGPSAALLFLGLTIGPLAVLTYLFDRSEQAWQIGPLEIPVRRIPILLVLAIIMTLTPGLLNLHAVRIANDNSLRPKDRASLAATFDAWVKRCSPGPGPVRPIIVAVSGGASRAGLWGARVLTAVDKIASDGGTSIFAVSSVSGGSLGAAAYTALRSGYELPPQSHACGLPPLNEDQVHARDTAIVEAMRADALGPTLAGSLFGDAPRALLGIPATLVRRLYEFVTGSAAPMRGGDRAEALERAFEHNWEKSRGALESLHAGKPVPFSDAFLALAYKGRAVRGDVPIWIANGTDAQNGDRVLTVPFGNHDDQPAPSGKANHKGHAATRNAMAWSWPFLAAQDALALVGQDIPISTAISNTARFPYLSPAGELSPVKIDPDHDPTQIIDGGYFENEGLTTALELADWLRTYGHAHIKRPVWPIIVQATADADQNIDPRTIVQCGRTFHDDPATSRGRERPLQLLAPIEGISSVRAGHAAVALRQARLEYCETNHGQAFYHLYLFAPHCEPVPLNWVLSHHIAYAVWDYTLTDPFNKAQLKKLTRTLERNAARSAK